MALPTVGSLFDWLIKIKLTTRVGVVIAAAAPPDDVASAIMALHPGKLVAHRGPSGVMRWRRGNADPEPSLLDQPLAGFRARNGRMGNSAEVLSWIDETVIDAARAWAPRSPRWGLTGSDAELAQAGIAGETFLSSRLWRPPTDREASLFWQEVESCLPALWRVGPGATPNRCITSAESCAGPGPGSLSTIPGRVAGADTIQSGRPKGLVAGLRDRH